MLNDLVASENLAKWTEEHVASNGGIQSNVISSTTLHPDTPCRLVDFKLFDHYDKLVGITDRDPTAVVDDTRITDCINFNFKIYILTVAESDGGRLQHGKLLTLPDYITRSDSDERTVLHHGAAYPYYQSVWCIDMHVLAIDDVTAPTTPLFNRNIRGMFSSVHGHFLNWVKSNMKALNYALNDREFVVGFNEAVIKQFYPPSHVSDIKRLNEDLEYSMDHLDESTGLYIIHQNRIWLRHVVSRPDLHDGDDGGDGVSWEGEKLDDLLELSTWKRLIDAVQGKKY